MGLYAFGRKLKNNCQLCPEKKRLVEMIPGMTTVLFSSLKPGTHIVLHVGYPNVVLRCHLGLIVPARCALQVKSQTRNWQEGKCLIFDDSVEHEAWNYSEANRIVLVIDFKKSDATGNDQSQGICSPEVAQLVQKLSTYSL